MDEIRGKNLKEWKDYCKSDNVPIKTMKYIACLEERIEALTIPVVGSSAWYCKVENINGQWFEIITGLNETDVAIKIDKTFGKGTRFEIQNEFKLM